MSNSMETVSVLFVRSDSIYKTLGVDCWDIVRDARLWPGGNPIIAHPPCRAWGKLKAFAKPRPDEKQLAIWSIEQIRKYGGVLEHPRHSSLWKEMKLPVGQSVDEFGGFSISVNQSWWGHLAEKNTLLYICGILPAAVPKIPLCFNRIEFVVSTSKNKNSPKKEIPKKMREETPLEFAKFLIDLASRCKIKHLKIDNCGYYLENTDQRGGLLIKIESPGVHNCTYSYVNAMRFDTKVEAMKFIKDNHLQKSNRVHFFNGEI